MPPAAAVPSSQVKCEWAKCAILADDWDQMAMHVRHAHIDGRNRGHVCQWQVRSHSSSALQRR